MKHSTERASNLLCQIDLDLALYELFFDYLTLLLAFLTYIMAEIQALTEHVCFIDPLHALAIVADSFVPHTAPTVSQSAKF